MCNLYVLLPCFNSFDFLNWYFLTNQNQVFDQKLVWKAKRRQNFARIPQKLQKICKNTLETPWWCGSNKLIQSALIITSQIMDPEQLLWRKFNQNRKFLQKNSAKNILFLILIHVNGYN